MTEALQGLADVARLEAEREGLQLQLSAANDQLTEAERRQKEAVAKLATETADVERLESYSMTRILAGLRGTRDVDLSRERAEQLAAQYAVAGADDRRRAAQREVDIRTERLAAIGDLEDRRTQLLALREREIAADPASANTHARLMEVSGRQGALEAELVQLQEAVDAAEHARQALGEASTHLSSAGSWATYDTFFGGGLVGDLVKHDKLDKAGELMRRADAALAHLGVELADVNVAAVGEVGITQLARTFDVWFDNIFSDYQVRDRIREAATRVDGLLKDIGTVTGELTARVGETEAAVAALEASRRELLLA